MSLKKKRPLWKNVLYFGKWIFLVTSLKKLFFSKNNFFYNSGGNLQSLKIKKIRVFLKKKFFPNFTMTAA